MVEFSEKEQKHTTGFIFWEVFSV